MKVVFLLLAVLWSFQSWAQPQEGKEQLPSFEKNALFTNAEEIYEININESWLFSTLTKIENQKVWIPLKAFPSDLLEGLVLEGKQIEQIKGAKFLVLPASFVKNRNDDALSLKIFLTEDYFKTQEFATRREKRFDGVPVSVFYTNYHLYGDVKKLKEAKALLSSTWVSKDGWNLKNNMLWTGKAFNRQETSWKKEFKSGTLVAGDSSNYALPGFNSMNSFGLRFASPYFSGQTVMSEYLPAFKIGGFAVTPSKVDLYLNNQIIQQTDIGSGRYNLEIPYQTQGYGVFKSYITDVTGKPTMTEFNFYNNADMVKSGVNEYAVSLGLIKKSNDEDVVSYDKPIASLIYKGGVTNWWTQDLFMQKSSYYGVVSSLSHVTPHPYLGKFSLGVSKNSLGQTQKRVGWEHRGGLFSITTDYKVSKDKDGFCLGYGQGCVFEQKQAFLGFGLPFGLGNMNVGKVFKNTEKGAVEINNVFWTRPITKSSTLIVTASNTKTDGQKNKSVYVGLSIALDGKIYTNTSYSKGVEGVFQESIYKGENEQHPEYGFGALSVNKTREGTTENMFYGGRMDKFSYQMFGINDKNGFNANVGLDGAIVYMPEKGYVQTTKNIQNGLIYVEIENMEGKADIFHENKYSGTSDMKGRYLITTAIAKNTETVNIDVNKLPNNLTLEEYKKRVYVPTSGATSVFFKSKPLPFVVRIEGLESGITFSMGEEMYVIGEKGVVSVEKEGPAEIELRGGKVCKLDIKKSQKNYKCD